jgi:hypothetical protein
MFGVGFFMNTWTGILISFALVVGVAYWVLPALFLGSAALMHVNDVIELATRGIGR